jgi:hypothetical protein
LEIEGAPAEPFAVALEPLEGDLERMAPNEVAQLHPVFSLVGRDATAHHDDPDVAPQQGELWRGIALVCFIALVLETLWAAWLGRSRRSVK